MANLPHLNLRFLVRKDTLKLSELQRVLCAGSHLPRLPSRELGLRNACAAGDLRLREGFPESKEDGLNLSHADIMHFCIARSSRHALPIYA